MNTTQMYAYKKVRDLTGLVRVCREKQAKHHNEAIILQSTSLKMENTIQG